MDIVEGDILKEFDSELENLKKEIVIDLAFEGEKAVSKARRDGNYQDRTGNLRTSVGYAVINDGIETMSANATTEKIIRANGTDGLGVILADGMEYGTHVEAKGYDVLSSAYLELEKNVKRKYDDK